MPNSASGRSHASPQSPLSKVALDNATSAPKLGSSMVKTQSTKPVPSPQSAPARVAPRQSTPPSIAGKNCATPPKEIVPIAASAPLPPEAR